MGCVWNRGLLKSATGTVGVDLSFPGVRDSSSLMKLEDEACYVLLPVILQAMTFSLSLDFEQQPQRETNRADEFRSSFVFFALITALML